MKKLFQIIFMATLSMVLFAVPAFAAVPTSEKIPVTVQSVQNAAWTEAPVEQGQASVQLEDGVQVTVSGEALDGLTLVVYPILHSDTEAREWFESCMENYGTNLYPLELYFVDDQGSRVEVRSVFTVTVTYTGEYQAPAVFYLAEDGTVTEMESQAQGTAVTFTTNHNSYYVLAETEGVKTSEEIDTEQTNTPSGDGISPQTGDVEQPLLWNILLLVCGGAFVIILVSAKKHKEK